MPLSELIRFGTSTWTYEGWQGQVYKHPYAKTAFTRECLGEFCQYLYKAQPLFSIMAVHYEPIELDDAGGKHAALLADELDQPSR